MKFLPTHSADACDEALSRLRELVNQPDTPNGLAKTALARIRRLEDARDYLARSDLRVAFVGRIGVGKSALISSACDFVLSDDVETGRQLQRHSVLSLGGGATTVCEVRIRHRPSDREGQVGVTIKPHTLDEMRALIRDFADDEWRRRQPGFKTEDVGDDQVPTPREVQRFIRSMTNTAKTKSSEMVGRSRRVTTHDPLDDLVRSHEAPSSLAAVLLQRADLMNRTETTWWFSEDEGLKQLQQKFDQVNFGREPTAVLPKLIELLVEAPLPTSHYRDGVEVIDTRGFDGQLGARTDILTRLRDERCVVVACTGFNEAPSDTLRTLLKGCNDDATLRPALDRMAIVLADRNFAAEVNGADGDRELGQTLKMDECRRRLEDEGLAHNLLLDMVIAHDCIRDNKAILVDLIDDVITRRLQAAREMLEQQVADANSFLNNLEDHRIAQAREDVDERLRVWATANRPTGRPIRDPLDGLFATIRDCRYASRVHAMDRRNGSYYALDAYEAIASGVRQRLTNWLDGLHKGIEGEFRAMEATPDFQDVKDHIRLRRSAFVERYRDFIEHNARGVQTEVMEKLRDDEVWEDCVREWGRGSGFKDRVVDHLTNWSLQHSDDLTVHESRGFRQPVLLDELEDNV